MEIIAVVCCDPVMSPKSRGRQPRRSVQRRSPSPRSGSSAGLATEMLRDARELLRCGDVLAAEMWVSAWLGQAWVQEQPSEDPDHQCSSLTDAEQVLALEVIGAACDHPSPHGRAAVEVLGRFVAAPEQVLAGALARLSSQVPPGWATTGGWQAVSACQAVTAWQDVTVLMVEFAGPRPHALVVALLEVGGLAVTELAITAPGVRVQFERQPMVLSDAPTVLQEVEPEQALAVLAEALHRVDHRWPRPEGSSLVQLRALAWQRAAAHLRKLPTPAPLGEAEREALLAAFLAQPPPGPDLDRDVVRSLAEIFLDFGADCLPHPFAWSPLAVHLLVTQVLPCDICLDDQQRDALCTVLAAWIQFALTERELAAPWMTPVVAAVAECHAEFLAKVDDPTQWSLIKQLRVRLQQAGIDLTDPDAVCRELLSSVDQLQDD